MTFFLTFLVSSCWWLMLRGHGGAALLPSCIPELNKETGVHRTAEPWRCSLEAKQRHSWVLRMQWCWGGGWALRLLTPRSLFPIPPLVVVTRKPVPLISRQWEWFSGVLELPRGPILMAQWAVKIYCLLSLWAESTSGNSTNSSASHITGLPLPGLRWLIPLWGSDAGFLGGSWVSRSFQHTARGRRGSDDSFWEITSPKLYLVLVGLDIQMSTLHACCPFSRVRLFVTPWAVAHQAPVHGILQARMLEWGAMPFPRDSSQPRDRTQVSFCLLH